MVDDLLATGGTLYAAEQLIANIPDSEVIGSICIFEIEFFNGKDKLSKPFDSLIVLRGIE